MPGPGRPSKFTPEIANEICRRIVSGESLRSVCFSENMPSRETVYQWMYKARLESDKDSPLARFPDNYRAAREYQAEVVYDDLLEIADDATNDWMDKQFGQTTARIPDPETAQRSKLRVDTRKWILARMNRKRYGEKVTQEHTGEGGGPVNYVVQVEPNRDRGADDDSGE